MKSLYCQDYAAAVVFSDRVLRVGGSDTANHFKNRALWLVVKPLEAPRRLSGDIWLAPMVQPNG